MANQVHQDLFYTSVNDSLSDSWNAWCKKRELNPILSEIKLRNVELDGFSLNGCVFENSNFENVTFRNCNIAHCDFDSATFVRCNFINSDLDNSTFRAASIVETNFLSDPTSSPSLVEVNFESAEIKRVVIRNALCIGSNFSYAELEDVDFSDSNLKRSVFVQIKKFDYVILDRANLQGSIISFCEITNSSLVGCKIEGVSFWNNKRLTKDFGNSQQDLVLKEDPLLVVQKIETAQFISMVEQERLDEIINEVTSKSVLLLGRFIERRKVFLDAIGNELRNKNYVPIIFDFDIPESRDVTETITLLARISCFIIADLSEGTSVQQEIAAIAPHIAVPIVPIIQEGFGVYSMFRDYWKYDWILNLFRYVDKPHLLANLELMIIDPAQEKSQELNKRKSEAWNP